MTPLAVFGTPSAGLPLRSPATFFESSCSKKKSVVGGDSKGPTRTCLLTCERDFSGPNSWFLLLVQEDPNVARLRRPDVEDSQVVPAFCLRRR